MALSLQVPPQENPTFMAHRSDTACPGSTRFGVDVPCVGTGKKHWEAKRCKPCADAQKRTKVHVPDVPPNPEEDVAADRDKKKHLLELDRYKRKYAEALNILTRQEEELKTVLALSTGLDTFTIEPKYDSRRSEATAVIVASDWHIEEKVGGEVGGLNVSNVSVAKSKAKRFFQSALRLLTLLQQDVTISNVVLALLGDFISGTIHEELADTAELLPMHALVTAQNWIISGIQFLLDHSTITLTIPCHSGNHARTTKKTRFACENGHSLEYLMYLHLAAHFRNEPRVTFIIPEGMHSYLDIYDTTVRFQHGHGIKYGGGVGGIYIPINKAISQYNKARHADLDVMGHFHSLRDGGNFIVNGSLIGYSAFALSIRADFEKPKQCLFLIDKRRARTCLWPVFLED